MPISKYDSAFGGKKGAASKALAAMRDQYGDKKGTSVFYATKNKKTGGRGHRRKRVPRDRRQQLVEQFQSQLKGRHG